MAKKRNTRRVQKQRPLRTDCVFCEEKTQPDYKNYKELTQFLSDRAKIMGNKRTGVCSRHQRMLGREIKRARHLGLLPYSPEI